MLGYYAQHLSAVEINNTFYRLPKASVLAGWAEQVPDGFRFALKASRRITHIKRLRDAVEETAYLFRAAGSLGVHLGPILFQLPPYLRKDLGRLSSFLETLPARATAAFEFRHPSWFDDEVYQCLQARDVALCVADTDEGDAALVATAAWGYLRLRRGAYTEADLALWAQRVRAQDWRHAYVFFKHEDEAAGPRLAARFRALAQSAVDAE
jgi:uncharacterized protein YecE (DUF72 family)